MKSNKKILIIRFNAIGDVVMSTIIPFSIKLRHSASEIHYLTSKNNAKMLKNCSYIDKIIPFNGNISGTIKELFKQRYDCIICLNYTLKSYLFTFLSFPKRIIFKSFKGTSWVENYFNTAKELYNDLVMPNRLCMHNEDFKSKYHVLKIINKYPKPHILINPGRLYNQIRQGRVWNIEKYMELSKKLLKMYGGTIFVNGSISERDYHMLLADKNIVILTGMYNLVETCAVISLCDLVISGDSGPCHIASAYNKKTVALLGSTSPDKIKPYGNNGYYIEPTTSCRYCWKKKCKFLKDSSDYAPCIESITPEMVIDKIKENNLLEMETKNDKQYAKYPI